MPSPVYDLVGGAFAHLTAPFASHPLDRQRAFSYLAAAIQQNVSWAQAEQDIRHYLASQGCTPDYIDDEVERARPYLEPWL